MLFAALLACEDDEPVDTGPPPFSVIGSDPEAGEVASSVVAPVQLILSADPDMDHCTLDTIRIDALRVDGAVAFPVLVALDLQGEGNLKVQPDEPYFRGYTYAVTVRGGDDGCIDVSRRPILPFYSTFEVP